MCSSVTQNRELRRSRSGALAELVAEPEPVSWKESLGARSLAKLAVLALLIAAMNYRQFPRMFRAWMDEQNSSHGLLIPLFSLYLLFARRHELISARRNVCLWGLPLVLLACLIQIFGYSVQNPLTCQVSMVLLAFALVLYLGGTQLARITWLPMLFLWFAVPIPAAIYKRVALPLQHLAAQGSAGLMQLVGVDIRVVASNLQLYSRSGQFHSLTVEEACAGISLLTAFVALAVAMAYLENRPIWQRVVMVAMGIPVAILCNIIRVAITCWMFATDRPEGGQDFMHEFTGIVMLAPALAMLWLLGVILRKLFVEVGDDEQASGGEAPAAGGRP